MGFKAPEHVELTTDETNLAALVFAEQEECEWNEIADAMQALLKSLLDRVAIPSIRLQVFEDPECAEVYDKSPKQIFEGNGTSGIAIYRHPHFKAYLHYFVYGPNLPKDVIDGLVRLLNDDRGTSGMVMTQYGQFARDAVRRHRLDPRTAATEFHRLGLEIGMGAHDARVLRDAARRTR